MISTLAQATPIATIPVRNLEVATRFYEHTLGFTRDDAGSRDGVAAYRVGSGNLLVYESPFAGSNQSTAATWTGLDVDAVVNALRDRQVRFEHYDMPDTTREGDVHVSGDMRVAWFKDPDGNIHALVNG